MVEWFWGFIFLAVVLLFAFANVQKRKEDRFFNGVDEQQKNDS